MKNHSEKKIQKKLLLKKDICIKPKNTSKKRNMNDPKNG
jgi:hypothetical protein